MMIKLSFSVRPRINASGATSIILRFDQLLDSLGLRHHIVKGVVGGADTGRSFSCRVPEKSDQLPLRTARLARIRLSASRRARHRHRHGKVRFSGARWADAEYQIAALNRIHVAALHHGLRRDRFFAEAPLLSLSTRPLKLVSASR